MLKESNPMGTRKVVIYSCVLVIGSLLLFFGSRALNNTQSSNDLADNSYPSSKLSSAKNDSADTTSATDPTSNASSTLAANNAAVLESSQSPDSLPVAIESTLMVGSSINSDKVNAGLEPKSFDKLFEAFEKQRLSNAFAMEVSAAYKEQVEQSLAKTENKNLDLKRLACGVHFCVAELHSKSQTEFDAWENQIYSEKTRDESFQSMSIGPTEQHSDGNYHRIFFGIDPSNNSFVGTLKPTPNN
jgi:hypothetical protein